MQEWGYATGGIHVEAAIRSNPSVAGSWPRNGDALDYKRSPGVNAVTAIQQLFRPSPDFESAASVRVKAGDPIARQG